jgi:hypothetical protein
MSHYLDMKVPLTDPEAIVRALGRMGIPQSAVEVHQKPVTLIGYSGETRQANIIVRKQWLESHRDQVKMQGYTCYADLGYQEQKDGTYKAFVDDHNFNPEWVKKMSTYHNVELAKIQLDAKKIKYTEGVEAGKPYIEADLPMRTSNPAAQQTLGFSA